MLDCSWLVARHVIILWYIYLRILNFFLWLGMTLHTSSLESSEFDFFNPLFVKTKVMSLHGFTMDLFRVYAIVFQSYTILSWAYVGMFFAPACSSPRLNFNFQSQSKAQWRHHHGHCCPFGRRPSIQTYPNTPWEHYHALVWCKNTQRSRYNKYKNIATCNNFCKWFHIKKIINELILM